jgi:PAS domain S-box-containing protein
LKLKADLENLKARLMYLMKENEALKQQLASVPVPTVNARTLINEDIVLPDNIMHLVMQLTARTAKGAAPPNKLKNVSFCISNAISPDMPLVYASPGFLQLTGYEMHEILGRNCRFLQGPETDRAEVAKLKAAILDGRDYTTVLLNYRKDGSKFWDQVLVAHIKDMAGRTFFFVGIQTKVI